MTTYASSRPGVLAAVGRPSSRRSPSDSDRDVSRDDPDGASETVSELLLNLVSNAQPLTLGQFQRGHSNNFDSHHYLEICIARMRLSLVGAFYTALKLITAPHTI